MSVYVCVWLSCVWLSKREFVHVCVCSYTCTYILDTIVTICSYQQLINKLDSQGTWNSYWISWQTLYPGMHIMFIYICIWFIHGTNISWSENFHNSICSWRWQWKFLLDIEVVGICDFIFNNILTFMKFMNTLSSVWKSNYHSDDLIFNNYTCTVLFITNWSGSLILLFLFKM